MRFVPAPFGILSHSYPETAAESSKERKMFRLFVNWQHPLHNWDFDYKLHTPIDLPHTPAGVIDAGIHVRVRTSTTNKSDAIAGMFMPIFEGELGDPRFINLAQAFRHHAIVLFLGRARER